MQLRFDADLIEFINRVVIPFVFAMAFLVFSLSFISKGKRALSAKCESRETFIPNNTQTRNTQTYIASNRKGW